MPEIPKDLAKFKGPTREKARRALVGVLEGEEMRSSTKLVSVTKMRGCGAGDANCATECLRAWRAGRLSVGDSWDDPAPSAGGAPPDDFDRRAKEARDRLERMIREAKTDGDREAVSHEVMAQLAGGLIETETAKEIKGQLGEALKAAAAKRATEPPPEDPTRLLLMSELALKVARAVDLVVSDDRRKRLLAYVSRELEQDLDEERNTDQGGAT